MAVDLRPAGNRETTEGDPRRHEEQPLVIAGVYIGTEAEQKARAEAVHRLLDEWMADGSGYDEETWPEIRRALNENRRQIGARLLFPDEEP